MKGQKEKRNEKTPHKTEGKWRGIHSEMLGKERQGMRSEEKAKEILELGSKIEARSDNQCLEKKRKKKKETEFLRIICTKIHKTRKYVE